MPGWLVASEGKLTVALDITLTEELRAEGVARELINRIQNIRKDSGFEVTDKIRVEIEQKEFVAGAIAKYAGYIASQTLAVEVKAAARPEGGVVVDSDVDDEPIRIAVTTHLTGEQGRQNRFGNGKCVLLRTIYRVRPDDIVYNDIKFGVYGKIV